MMKKERANYESFISFEEIDGLINGDAPVFDGITGHRWELIKLYLQSRLTHGGDFTFPEIATKAARFASIVSSTIDGLLDKKHIEHDEEVAFAAAQKEKAEEEERARLEREGEYERTSPEMRESIYQEILREQKGLPNKVCYSEDLIGIGRGFDYTVLGILIPNKEMSSMRRRARYEIDTLTPMQRYEQGMRVKYSKLDPKTQELIFWQWMEARKKNKKCAESGNAVLSTDEWEVFYHRRQEFVDKLPPIDRAEWGDYVPFDMLTPEQQGNIYRRFMSGEGQFSIFKKNISKAWNNFVMPNEMADKWTMERREIKKKGEE